MCFVTVSSKMRVLLKACYCREWNKRVPEDQARQTYERALKLEQEFGEYFTGEAMYTFIILTMRQCYVTVKTCR